MSGARWRGTLALTPSFIVWAGLFAAPMLWLFVVSFWRIRQYRLVTDTTLDNYLLAVGEYRHAIVFTVVIAAIVALITTVFAFALGYLIRFRAGRWGTPLLFVALTTLFGGYLVKIYAWKALLGTDGILNLALLEMRVIAEPLPWLLYSPVAIVITLVHFLLPYALLSINASLRGVADAPIDAARDLGAGSLRILATVILPQCQRGVLTAFGLSFFLSAGDYVTPQLVGGPNSFMVGNFIQSQFMNRMNAPVGGALAYTTLLVTLLVFLGLCFAYRRLMRALAS